MNSQDHECSQPLRYFMPEGETPGTNHPERIRLAVITSLRDLVEEGVGQTRQVEGRDVYVKGTLQHLIEQTSGGRLARYLEIALVIHDDVPRDFQKLKSAFPMEPVKGQPWFFPPHLRTQQGDRVTSLLYNIPSTYRQLPRNHTALREKEKMEFESRIRRMMEIHEADILLSDHFLCRFQFLVNQQYFDLRNKVLNGHPGITDVRHPFRTPGVEPYQDAIRRARGELGAPHSYTGASFHVIDDHPDMDNGTVLFDVERTPVSPDDHWLVVCERNYRLSKNLAVMEGLSHYAHNIYPRVDQLSLDSLTPYATDRPIYGSEAA